MDRMNTAERKAEPVLSEEEVRTLLAILDAAGDGNV